MASEDNCFLYYFNPLPHELKVKVFSYVGAVDAMNFCKAYPPAEYLLHDKHVMGYVSFSKQYKYNGRFLQSFLTQEPYCDLITVLNINNVYWVKANTLRQCIVKLISLECLFAIGTELGFTVTDCQLYSSLKKLKEIALSLTATNFNENSVELFPDVVGLYLHVYRCDLDVTYIRKLINRLKKLRDLWVIDCGFHNGTLSSLIADVPGWINSVTLEITLPENSLQKTPIFYRPFERHFCDLRAELIFEKSQGNAVNIYKEWKLKHRVWDDLLNELRRDVPFDQKDARKLALEQDNLYDIKFEELNFHHKYYPDCGIRFQNLVYQALTLPNCTHLKKLSINFCVCDDAWRQNHDPFPWRKKQKHHENAKDGVDTSSLQDIVKNCPRIEVLEIWGCEQAQNSRVPGLTYIKDLSNLRSLSLIEIPPHVDGSFLIDVCKSCLLLRSLKVTAKSEDGQFNTNLLEALKNAKNLRDFRFENRSIPMHQIFETLSTAHIRIERLYLNCTSSDDFLTALESFCESNHQLVFLMLIFLKLGKATLDALQDLLKKYDGGRSKRERIYCARSGWNFFPRFTIPQIHSREMVRIISAVAVLDVFNGFVETETKKNLTK